MQPLPEPILAQLNHLVARHLGLHFPRERWPELERNIQAAAHAAGFEEPLVYAQWLLSAQLTLQEIGFLARYLTIGETYFFRGPETFDALYTYVLPELIQASRQRDRRLRIWSAGCATGEEPYSIAILLSTLLPDWHKWKVSILATDINPDFLQRARAGIYRRWSFRAAPPWLQANFFRELEPGQFEIHPSIRQRVQFAQLNLVSDDYPSAENHTDALDLIFCRNVLMYFTPEQVDKVIGRLENCLREGGWLVVGPGEATFSVASRFTAIEFPQAIFYQKSAKARPRLAISRPAQFWQDANESPAQRAIGTDIHSPVAHHSSSENEDTVSQSEPLPLWSHVQSEAIALYEQGDYAAAEKVASQVVARTPTEGGALLLLARICADQRRHHEALAWCKQAISADRLNPDAYYLQAMIHKELGNLDDAVRLLKQALYLDPNIVMAHFALGNVVLRQGHLRLAEKCFANTLELLEKYEPGDIVPESHGLSAGQLAAIIRDALSVNAARPGVERT